MLRRKSRAARAYVTKLKLTTLGQIEKMIHARHTKRHETDSIFFLLFRVTRVDRLTALYHCHVLRFSETGER